MDNNLPASGQNIAGDQRPEIAAHSPTPWSFMSRDMWKRVGAPQPVCHIGEFVILAVLRPIKNAEDEADYICNAVNCHAKLLAALKTCMCPAGGWTGMPKDVDPTVENCMAAGGGTCGCDYGAIIRKATGAP